MDNPRRWIGVIGESNLHNEMLAYVLEREIGVEATIEESFPLLEQRMSESSGNHTLLLVNARQRALERAVAMCKAWNRTGSIQCTVALFDLQRGDNLEQVAIAQGVRGFFYTQDSLELVAKGVDKLFAGEIWVPRELLFTVAQNRSAALEPTNNNGSRHLTNREMQILAHVCTGLSNDEIAGNLNVSAHTVKTHLYRIFKKIQVSNRFQASLWAAKHL